MNVLHLARTKANYVIAYFARTLKAIILWLLIQSLHKILFWIQMFWFIMILLMKNWTFQHCNSNVICKRIFSKTLCQILVDHCKFNGIPEDTVTDLSNLQGYATNSKAISKNKSSVHVTNVFCVLSGNETSKNVTRNSLLVLISNPKQAPGVRKWDETAHWVKWPEILLGLLVNWTAELRARYDHRIIIACWQDRSTADTNISVLPRLPLEKCATFEQTVWQLNKTAYNGGFIFSSLFSGTLSLWQLT